MSSQDGNDDDLANAVLAGLSDDPFYGLRCKFCLSVFYLDKQDQCQQPECLAKASRERTAALLTRLRERRQK